MHCKIFSNILSLYPLDASKTLSVPPSLPLMITKNVSIHCEISTENRAVEEGEKITLPPPAQLRTTALDQTVCTYYTRFIYLTQVPGYSQILLFLNSSKFILVALSKLFISLPTFLVY